jgi:SAM-dependent methyltransferase
VRDLDELWRFVLRRPIEAEERAATEARIADGMSYASLVQELATSPEFEHLKRLEDAVAWAAAQRRAGERPRNLEAPPGVDERPIEIPWCLARVRPGERVLDVGYGFAEPAYLEGLGELGDVTGVDLVTREVPGVTSVMADVRKLPFENASFDVAIVISTLEHVGRDNTQYGLGAEVDESLDAGLRELRRVAERVLVTVPTGERELRPEQAVYEPSEWIAQFTAAGFVVFEDELYELTSDGWRSVPELSAGTHYAARGPGASAVLCAELRAGTVGERLRLALRDRRHRDEVRRVTG